MTKPFNKPSFKDGSIELRFADNEVSLYATETGLRELVDICNKLLDKPQKGHIHLEDYGVLTKDSLIAAIAIFEE